MSTINQILGKKPVAEGLFFKAIEESSALIEEVSSEIVDLLLESSPSVGDVVQLTTGSTAKVIEIGQFSDLKVKYPREADRAIEFSTAPESRFKTTWVLQDEKGEKWLVGSSALRFFTKSAGSSGSRYSK